MIYFIVSAGLLFLGFAVAAIVFIFNFILLTKRVFHGQKVTYVIISFFYGASVLDLLIRQSSGIACTLPSTHTLLAYGGLLILHCIFLVDTLKSDFKMSEGGVGIDG